MKPHIGITETNRQHIAEQLAKLLADEYVLYTKTRNAHWNVEGPDFYDKHNFFQIQFEQLDVIIDSIAERIRTLGHFVGGSLTQFLSLTHLAEQNAPANDSLSYIKALLADHESIIVFLRENTGVFAEKYNDLGTSDFTTGLMQDHEKMAWLLRSHLK